MATVTTTWHITGRLVFRFRPFGDRGRRRITFLPPVAHTMYRRAISGVNRGAAHRRAAAAVWAF